MKFESDVSDEELLLAGKVAAIVEEKTGLDTKMDAGLDKEAADYVMVKITARSSTGVSVGEYGYEYEVGGDKIVWSYGRGSYVFDVPEIREIIEKAIKEIYKKPLEGSF